MIRTSRERRRHDRLRERLGCCRAPAASSPRPSCVVAGRAAQEPFYKGKRLTLLVNFAPGGSTDIEGRLFARHLGQPHRRRARRRRPEHGRRRRLQRRRHSVGEVAPRDGTMLGYFSGTAWNTSASRSAGAIDLRSYEFIAYQPGTTVYYVRKDVAPGMKEPADIAKAQGLVAGGHRGGQPARPPDPARPRHPRRAAIATSPAIAAACRPGSRCSAARFILLRGVAVDLSRRGRADAGEAR